MKGLLAGSKSVVVAAVLLSGCASLPNSPVGLPLETAGKSESTCTIPAELRSWRVFAQGRHMRLDALGGCGTVPFSGEYVDSAAISLPGGVVGFGNIDTDRRVLPPGGEPKPERTEARYELTVEAARCISKVRLYENPYELFGPNSSSGLRASMSECGIPLPEHVPGRGGMLSSFPGVDHDAGRLRLESEPGALGLPDIFVRGS